MQFRADIAVIRTVPFSEQEIEAMDRSRRAAVSFGEQKVIGEEKHESIEASNLEELRSKILQAVERFHPTPIIVKTDAFPDSFLIGRHCYHADPKGIFEGIAYHLKPDSPKAIAIRKDKEDREMRKRAKLDQPNENENEKQISEDDIKRMREDSLKQGEARIAETMGMEKYEDFITFMKLSMADALNQTSGNLQEAIPKAHERLMQRYYEHGGKGAHVRWKDPKADLANSIILYRVIGRNNRQQFNHMRYILRMHALDASVISNSIADS